MSKRPKASLRWRPLPSDKSMHQFCKTYKESTGREKLPSVTWIKATLAELATGQNSDSIYHALYGKRKTMREEIRDTSPIKISWETERLIQSVLRVRDATAKEEYISPRQVLNDMAKELGDEAAEQYRNAFVRYTMFENPGIQQALLRSFQPLLKKRIRILENHLFNPELKMDIARLERALEQIDVLIYEFYKELPDERPDDARQLNMLYHELNAPRKELLEHGDEECEKIADYCWSPNCDVTLIKALKKQISATSRFPEQPEIDAFLKNYKKYLDAAALPESKISEFEQRYRALSQYYQGQSSVEQFREEITEELYSFARSIFEDLKYLDTIEISWTGYRKTHANSAYARFVLADVHRDIQMNIHTALIPLRAVYSYFYFAGFENVRNWYEINQISKACVIIGNQIQKLSEKYSDLKSADPDRIYELYQKHAEPIFGREITPKPIVQQGYYGIGLNEIKPEKKLCAMSELLKITCQIVVAFEVEAAIERLTKEYSQMLSLLSM